MNATENKGIFTAIAVLLVFYTLNGIIKKIYLDRSFKKFEITTNFWVFRAGKFGLISSIIGWVIALAVSLGFILGNSNIAKEVTLSNLIFGVIIYLILMAVFILKPLKILRKKYYIEFNNKELVLYTDVVKKIDLSKLTSVSLVSNSNYYDVLELKIDSDIVKIDLGDFGLYNYNKRIVKVLKTIILEKEINSI